MTTYQNAIEIAKDKMQQGLIGSDEANVLIVKLIGVQVVTKLPSQVRRALNAAVKNGELGHIKKEGLKPEVYHHINSRARALDIRDTEMREALESIAKVCF